MNTYTVKIKKYNRINRSNLKLILVSTILFSLSACGGGSSDNSNNASDNNGTNTSVPVTASNPTATNPVSPNNPIVDDPGTPVTPSSPTTPVTPSSPTTPVTPSSPTTPVTPSSPTTPVTPSSPTTPVTPSSPTTPADPGTPASSSNPASTPVTTGSGNPDDSLTLICTPDTTSSATSGSDLISADTPSSDNTRLFQIGNKFNVAITTRGTSQDTLNWAIADNLGKTVASGSFSTPNVPTTTNLACQSTLAGYFAISASLSKAGGQLTSQGTRPNGIATFGIIPNLLAVLPTVSYPKQEQHRFGMQGFNGFNVMLEDLGISSTIDDRELSAMEPTSANTFNPQADNLDASYKDGKIMRLIRLDGIPAWASSTGAQQDSSNLPKDLNYYQNYMSRVGTESEKIREQYYPTQSKSFYQVTWEPSWQDTDANFVNLYKSVYTGLHSTDPNAVVMGPADPFPSLTTSRLKRLASLGFKNYVDGIATHGYYDAGTSPSHPPERLATDSDPANAANALMNEIKNLRQEMQTDYTPNMKLFVTETGISYDLGSSYGPNYPSANILYAQAAVTARTHIILLGEGADQTYVFYGADYPGETGYGTFFDLNDAQGAFGANNISPKPSALAVAAMTHILDGTTTLGPVNNMPSGLYAYSFQQLGGGKIITALWTHNNSVWDASVGFSSTYSKTYQLPVDSAGTSGSVKVIDMMGNPSTMNYTNGLITLNLTESPMYVVSNNVNIAKSNTTVPLGYLGN